MFRLSYKNFMAGNNASKRIESTYDSNFASYTKVDCYDNNYIKQRSRGYCFFSIWWGKSKKKHSYHCLIPYRALLCLH